MSDGKNDRDDLNAAYGKIHHGVGGALTGVGVFARHIWNLEMKLLRKIGVMPLFRRTWWLFVVLAILLLMFVTPLGAVFVITALCGATMDPKPEDDFIVPLQRDPSGW
ncbi:hypothetical protein [Pseudooceanicola atlanticus]|uniref:Uncharacterized protein n=1 Tax=Pseudooceanicola atlanticus TaxID=1461694 RepID=A0A0A0EBE5_9RHOB|nr:hypothetical protein [Pseudooceanicola atlanticus]KGM46572.1 hypothetical protein ATO9_23185 [Pseudooceanicola atlanticus]